MTEKIKLFMDLRNLRDFKGRSDYNICRELVNQRRYNLTGYFTIYEKLVEIRDDLYCVSVNREERVENFKREFNKYVQLVFVGETEEGRKLFNELKAFLHQPEPDLWR